MQPRSLLGGALQLERRIQVGDGLSTFRLTKNARRSEAVHPLISGGCATLEEISIAIPPPTGFRHSRDSASLTFGYGTKDFAHGCP